MSRDVLRIEEIANADTHETKSLLRSEGNTFPQRERDRRQLFARRRRGQSRWLATQLPRSASNASAVRFRWRSRGSSGSTSQDISIKNGMSQGLEFVRIESGILLTAPANGTGWDARGKSWTSNRMTMAIAGPKAENPVLGLGQKTSQVFGIAFICV